MGHGGLPVWPNYFFPAGFLGPCSFRVSLSDLHALLLYSVPAPCAIRRGGYRGYVTNVFMLKTPISYTTADSGARRGTSGRLGMASANSDAHLQLWEPPTQYRLCGSITSSLGTLVYVRLYRLATGVTLVTDWPRIW